jgi:transcriptional regulator with XRE-family HTH domain
MGIAADIQRELDKRGWRLYHLHQESGVLYPTLQSIMAIDSNPGIDKVAKIARAFSITIDELIENPKPVRKVSKKVITPKDLKKVLLEYGIRPDDIDTIMDSVNGSRKRQTKERGSGNGEAEEPVA